MCCVCMQLTLSTDTEHKCKLELLLSIEEDTDSASMDELLLKASGTFELSQTVSPDNNPLTSQRKRV